MNNELTIKNNSLVFVGIDKITLGIDKRLLNYRETPEGLKNIIDIITYGNWTELNIQWEYNGQSHIDYFCPLDSILKALLYAISFNLFKEPLSSDLYNCINGIYSGNLLPIAFINRFIPNVFKLDEYELYFDFYGYNPFLSFNRENYIFVDNSIYTKDYKKKILHNKRYMRVRRSMLCFYNRGLKTYSNCAINRLEFRICDFRADAILNPLDLLIPVFHFIAIHGFQIKNTLKRYIPSGSIKIDKEYINEKLPVLKQILWILE